MKIKNNAGSLTIETALVLPVFLFSMIGLLYIVHIFILQDKLQGAMTDMGLKLAKYAYFYDDYVNENVTEEVSEEFEAKDIFDNLIIGEIHGGVLKGYLSQHLELSSVNESIIYGGFHGIRLTESRWLDDEDCIDIILNYQIQLPMGFIIQKVIPVTQRIRVRGWTGHQVAAQYGTDEDKDNGDNDVVYITATGTVYHTNENCSYIKINLTSVKGNPENQRNESGGKYYPCETCCKEVKGENMTYYITLYGDRYHSSTTCSRIKRTVTKVNKSEVAHRRICEKCKKISSTE